MKKENKKTNKGAVSEKELEREFDVIENAIKSAQKSEESKGQSISINASKPILKIKKGDKLKIDGKECEVDAHYVLIDHGSVKEMAIELFDKNDKEYQLRYFDDQVESTLELYELQEIMYFKKQFLKISW